MKYVVIRDDDTNAFTPVESLEKLYRPFLEKRMPVNLGVIPYVNSEASLPNGLPEYFLLNKPSSSKGCIPIGSNETLSSYLKNNKGYCIAQHGCRHDRAEFDSADRRNLIKRLEEGLKLFQEAGLSRPRSFIAPQDLLSCVAMEEVSKRFSLISTNWFERSRLPLLWWPQYLLKKITQEPHWKAGGTILLSKPGTYLSCFNDYGQILDNITTAIEAKTLTVLTTHWWEYFHDGKPDEQLIGILHSLRDYLNSRPDIKVVSFDDLIEGRGAIG